jgi:crotonobetainyl-CoA:carnitine CoA-transferase CaiB-like acyl-CoA transferase
MAGRDAHREELETAIQSWVGSHPASEVIVHLQAAGVPISPVNSIADLLADPQVRARNGFITLPDPKLGRVTMAGPVPKLSRTPGGIRTAAPGLGEHTEVVLKELLGLHSSELESLRSEGIL